jgi:fucose permease
MNSRYILFSYLCLFCLGLLDNSRGPLYPQILNHFNMEPKMGSFLFSSSALSSFFIALFASRIIKRFALIKPSQLGILFFSLSAFCMGLAPATNLGVGLLIIGSLLLGLGVGIHSVSLNLIISENTTISARRRVFAGLHSMYGVASLLCPLVIGITVGKYLSWQDYFLIIGSFLLIFLLLSFFIKDTKKIDHNLKQSKAILSRPLWPMGMLFSCYVCAEVLLSSRLVYYLTDYKKISAEDSSFHLSLFFSLLLLGRVLFAIIPIRIKTLTLLKYSSALAMASVLLGIIYYPLALSIAGLFMSYFFPCAMDYVGRYFNDKEIDQAFSKVMILVTAGLVVLHFSFGQLTSLFGVQYSIWLIPSLLLFVMYILLVKLPSLAKSNIIVMTNK